MMRDLLSKENGMELYFEKLKKTFDEAKDIVLFGGGLGGVKTLQWITDNCPSTYSKIKYILDNNPMKWGTDVMGVPVIKPERKALADISLLAITCGEGDVIIEQLKSLGFNSSTKILIPDIAVIDRSGGDFQYIWGHIDELEAVYGMLCDDKSKCVLTNLLNFKLNHDMSLIEEIQDPFERQYFDAKLIHYGDDDVFVDGGSYDGDTIEYYRKWSEGKFSKIYAVEAEEANYNMLCERYASDTKVIPVQCALWNDKTTLRFNSMGSGSGTVSREGSIKVEADTIDHIIGDGKCDFIKMDIEGAEFEALWGARKTIEREKPTLMISVYHNREDYIRIPMLIKSICLDYKLYFRHYRKMSVQETICYALK